MTISDTFIQNSVEKLVDSGLTLPQAHAFVTLMEAASRGIFREPSARAILQTAGYQQPQIDAVVSVAQNVVHSVSSSQ